MNEDFIRQKITELRIRKNISEYKMSLDLGHSKSYIQSISSGRAMPSMSEFLYICEYFNISPSDFFNEEKTDAVSVQELNDEVKTLSRDDIDLLILTAKRLNKK